MRKITVAVQADYLETLSSGKASAALAELIWNSLDADANNVHVSLRRNPLGAIDEVIVEDDGHGVEFREVDQAFKNLGGSWKKAAERTRFLKRALHGQEGKGRFKAFALGSKVTWYSTFRSTNLPQTFEVAADASERSTFTISEPRWALGDQTGTSVRIQDASEKAQALDSKTTLEEINRIFALYLSRYPEIKITISGKRVDPASIIDRQTDIELESIEVKPNKFIRTKLTIIEWKIVVDRTLALADEEGFTLLEVPPRIHAQGFNFTGYLRSEYIRELYDNQMLFEGELFNKELQPIIDKAKNSLRSYFRERTHELTREVVEKWKQENVYPYQNEPQNVIEEVERQVFDVVALSVNEYLPDFQTSDTQTKKFNLHLLKQSIEQSPSTLKRILENVLDLPKEKQEELAELLQRTTLSAIIKASKVVADRLNFIRALETLVFDEESRETLRERDRFTVFLLKIPGYLESSST